MIDNEGEPIVIESFVGLDDRDPCISSVAALGQDGSVVIGEEAHGQAIANPRNTVYASKRLLGTKYSRAQNQSMTYTVRPRCASSGVDCQAATPSVLCGQEKLFPPELAGALILMQAKMLAGKQLGVQITKASSPFPHNSTTSSEQQS